MIPLNKTQALFMVSLTDTLDGSPVRGARVLGLGEIHFKLPNGSTEVVDISDYAFAQVPTGEWRVWVITGTVVKQGLAFKVFGRVDSATATSLVTAETIGDSIMAKPIGYTFRFTKPK